MNKIYEGAKISTIGCIVLTLLVFTPIFSIFTGENNKEKKGLINE